MTAEENKAVVRRYIEEAWNRHNIDATDELVSPEYLNHAARAEYQRAGVKYSLNWLFSVFPDHRFAIEDAVAEGDTVAVRGTMSGTHEGELLGIPPTGERVAVQQDLQWRGILKPSSVPLGVTSRICTWTAHIKVGGLYTDRGSY
jgi:predicted ester cyclase